MNMIRHGDPCTCCGGTWRWIGAGLLECDGWCGQTVRGIR